jgi:exodeoxyribonuclease VII small subunit
MAELKFDRALERLEKIVEAMEAGDLSLEESLKKYEEGVKLAGYCQKKLGEVEKKVEILQRSAEGLLSPQPFADEEDGAGE